MTSNISKQFKQSIILPALLFFVFFYSANAIAGQISLTWDANTEPNLGGYRLAYGQSSSSYTSIIDVGNQNSYTVTGLTEGQIYYFAVKAYDTTKTIESGYSNQVSQTVPVAVQANFSASPITGTAPLVVNFTNSSTGNITSWLWDFGDGTTSTGQTAIKSYSVAGTYTVKLTVSGPAGSNTATKTNYITVTAPTTAAPVANFSASLTSGVAPLTVNFSDTSTGSVTSWAWTFGDGSTSTSRNPSHTYSTAGTYTVSLTATGTGGSNKKTMANLITVSSTPSGSGGGTPTSPTGLVAAYGFEETSGATVVDSSGKGNNGVISGATRSGGRFGNALYFDGVNDWVTVNDAPTLDLTTGMTLEAWVYPTATLGTWPTVVMKEQSGALGYALYGNSDTNNPSGYIVINGEMGAQGGNALAANSWTHLATTYDGANLRLFVNGVQVSVRAASGPISVSNSALRIGGNGIWADEYFPGFIDEVRIYNRALAASEVTADMNKSVATVSAPKLLLGYQTLAPVTDSFAQGVVSAFQSKALSAGAINQLKLYVDAGSTATSVVAGIYSDNNGHPGTLIATGKLNAPAAGAWNNVVLPSVPVAANTNYWIAMFAPNGVLKFRDYPGNGSAIVETHKYSRTSSTLPGTWTTGSVYAKDGPVSAYGIGF